MIGAASHETLIYHSNYILKHIVTNTIKKSLPSDNRKILLVKS